MKLLNVQFIFDEDKSRVSFVSVQKQGTLVHQIQLVAYDQNGTFSFSPDFFSFAPEDKIIKQQTMSKFAAIVAKLNQIAATNNEMMYRNQDKTLISNETYA